MALFTSVTSRLFVVLAALLTATTLVAPAQAQSSFSSSGQTKRVKSKFQPLRDVIQSTIAPNTWDEVGGEGSISIVDSWGVAVVSQTQDVHDQIEALLATIRRVREQQEPAHAISIDETRPSAIHRGADAAKRSQIESVLDSKTAFEFLDVPLSEVVDALEGQHEIQIEIDQRAVEEAGLTTDAPVAKSLAGISLRSALKLLLRDLGLTFLIEDEVLQITTPEEAESRLVTVVYPVKDLAASVD